MLEELCRELNNWFDEKSDGSKNRHFGTFVISNRQIDLSDTDIKAGQYYRIVGSVYNDGVYQYGINGLYDEEFDGAIWIMSIPQEVVNLSNEIDAWKAKYQTLDSPSMSPFNSESFGGYSYTKSSGSSNGNAALSGTWQGAFSSRLSKWRKIRA